MEVFWVKKVVTRRYISVTVWDRVLYRAESPKMRNPPLIIVHGPLKKT